MYILLALINIIIMWIIINPFLSLTYKVAVEREDIKILSFALVCTACLFSVCVLAPMTSFCSLTLLTIMEQVHEWRKNQ